MASVSVRYLDNYVSKEGLSRVVVQVIWTNAKREVATGVKIEPQFWDYERMIVKRAHPNHKDLNLLIDKKKSDVVKILTEFRLRNIEITPSIFDDEIKRPSVSEDFLGFMRFEIDEKLKLKIVGDKSYNGLVAQWNKLKSFRDIIHFSDISKDLINDYRKWLYKKEQEPNTVRLALKTFGTYINKAFRRKLIDYNPFVDYQLPKKVKHIIFLTKVELDRLWKLYESEYMIVKKENDDYNRYQEVLRAFLFLCYTGMRIGEFKQLKFEHIIKRGEKWFVHFDVEKVDEQNLNPLAKKAKQLIKDANKFGVRGPIFSLPPESKMNKILKEICLVVKIDKDKASKMTLHKARHTFATILLVEYNADIITVSKLIGHKKVSTTLDDYGHFIQSVKETIIDQFD
jgi:integrase